jgi:type IV pilus assembly protein PilY1
MAFFVVDMQNGSIIKQFSFSGDSRMTYPLTAPPTAVDTNFDGYIDRVYIGDVGGQMWVFDLSDPNNVNNWTGKILFTAPVSSSEKHPIFYQASVAFDKNDIPWVYFGTGDRENPTSSLSPYAERFYAVQDDGSEFTNPQWQPRTEADLKNATSTTTFNQDTSKKGWYIILQKTSNTVENAVSKPVIFNQLVYFTATTYNPTTDPCAVAGTANLYTVEFLSGGGAIGIESLTQLSGTPNPTQFTQIGTGIPSSPVISVDSKARGSIMIGTSAGPIYSHTVISPPNKAVHYWREVIPFP